MATFFCEMSAVSKPFVVSRNKLILSKQRRIEGAPPAYAIREFRDDSQGRYWYVVTALEVRSSKDQPGPGRLNKS